MNIKRLFSREYVDLGEYKELLTTLEVAMLIDAGKDKLYKKEVIKNG